MRDFAQQHDYGTVGWPEGDVYMPQQKPMQDAEQQHGYKPKNWGMKMTYGAGSMPMQDFGMQHDISVAMSPPPAAANSLYEMVDMAVGDSKPRDFADRRFPWRPMSRIPVGAITEQLHIVRFYVWQFRGPSRWNLPREHHSERWPFQTFAGPQVLRTVSPSSSPSYGLGLFGMSPMSSSRCTSPGQDTAHQTDRFADVRRSPLGGPFSHDEFTGQAVEPTRSLGHDIMIQASPLAPVASSAWGPSISRHTSAAPVTEVYPCGHLPEVLQTRDIPPSPPPTIATSSFTSSVSLFGKPWLGPCCSGAQDKGTSEGPYVGPDGEQDYGHRGFSHAEHYSGEGDHTETCAVLGSASFVADGSTVPGAGRRSSIETTSNVTRSTKVVAMLPEVSVACFLLALLLALVASAALLSWTTRRHARLSISAEGTKKAVHPSNVTYIIPPFSVLPHDRHLQTIDPSLNGKTVTLGPHTWTVTPLTWYRFNFTIYSNRDDT
ncbi:hypothetical protein MRX96_025149 [Rhipicephalus microplus]